MKKDKSENGKEESAADLIQRIKAGSLDPAILTKEQRQMCVEALYFDSVSPTGVAQFLKVSDRTIRRDLEEIRLRNALTPDPDLARSIVGEYVHWVRIHRGNLMKMARDASASVSERAQAEYYASMINSDLITKLQSLGYLPKSADALLVMHKEEENQTNEKMSELLQDIEDMSRVAGDQKLKEKLIEMKETIIKENENDNEPTGA